MQGLRALWMGETPAHSFFVKSRMLHRYSDCLALRAIVESLIALLQVPLSELHLLGYSDTCVYCTSRAGGVQCQRLRNKAKTCQSTVLVHHLKHLQMPHYQD